MIKTRLTPIYRKFKCILHTFIAICFFSCPTYAKELTFAQLFDAFFGADKTKTTGSKLKFSSGESVSFEIEMCADGDTCRGTIVKNGKEENAKVRLVGIDAPEFSKGGLPEQPMAMHCKNTLNNLVKGEKVILKIYELDVYQRILGEIFFQEKNINVQLLREGCAEVYQGRPPKGLNDEPYLAAENSARGSRLGIWATQRYESPKEYRKRAKE